MRSALLAGTALPAAVTDTIKLTLSGDAYVAMVGDAADKGSCVVDSKPTPHRMTITGTDGPNAGKTLLAIFDFPDASTMRICYDLTGAAFPDSFTSSADNHLYSVTYVRQP